MRPATTAVTGATSVLTAASVRLRGRRPPRLTTLGQVRYSIAKGLSAIVPIPLTV